MPDLREGIVNIDGFKWSALKASTTELAAMDDGGSDLRAREDETFRSYHEHVRLWIEGENGKIFNTIGDCTIACWFPNISAAVAAAQRVQRCLLDFNRDRNRLQCPLTVRIGVSLGSPQDLPLAERGKASDLKLDEAGHLQKNCPPGRLLVSEEVYAKMLYGRDDFRPGPDIEHAGKHMRTYVWKERALTPQEEPLRTALPEAQRRSFPLLAFPVWNKLSPAEGRNLTCLQSILHEAFVIVGETRERVRQESPVHAATATSDAIGAMEVLAAAQTSPQVCAGIDEWVDTGDRAANCNVVVIGSPVVNLYAYAINAIMGPVRFTLEPDQMLKIIASDGDRELTFPEHVEHAGSARRYALVAVFQSPLNPDRNLLWIAGVSGMATQAAMRFVRDMVLNPSETIDRKARQFGIAQPTAAVVTPAAAQGWDLPDYQRGAWRVSDYTISWLGR